jgi:hypothetical protein
LFEALEDRSSKCSQCILSALLKLFIVLLSISIASFPFKNLFLVNHNDRFVREAEVFLEEFDAEFARLSHCFVSSAVECIKEYFLPDNVVCSVETQLLRQVGCGDFQLTVCGLDLVVDSRHVVKV